MSRKGAGRGAADNGAASVGVLKRRETDVRENRLVPANPRSQGATAGSPLGRNLKRTARALLFRVAGAFGIGGLELEVRLPGRVMAPNDLLRGDFDDEQEMDEHDKDRRKLAPNGRGSFHSVMIKEDLRTVNLNTVRRET